MLAETKKEIHSLLMELVKTLVSLIEEKDEFMRGHSQRVARNCVHFSRKLNLPKTEIEKIYFAGLLHDIGMVYIPIEIFQNSGKLNEDERIMIRQHPEVAEKILSNLSHLKEVSPIIRHHHEAFDGSGYPDGLRGDEIPIGARILCLVDSYDAMTSPRSDRPPMSMKDALEEITNNPRKRFDGKLINDFVEFIRSTAGVSKKTEEKEERGNVREIVREILEKYTRGGIDLPVLPVIVQEIQEIISEPTSTVDDWARVIMKDAVISIRLISVANSPVYRGTEKFYSVRMAIPRMGVKETQNIVTAIATKSLYETKSDQFRMLMEKLWLHSLATAYGAKAIAKKLALGDLEKFFLIGLVHDIGKAPLFKTLSETLPQEESLDMADVIASVQEIHSGFGSLLLERWGFTKDFVRIARHHDGPKVRETTEQAILVINLANLLTRKIGFSLFDDEVELSDIESGKLLQIPPDTLHTICEETKKIIEASAHTF
jgi:putative nucleotidyltransferase with HDIG domain